MKEHYNNEEINLLSKIKEDNKKNIENIKKFYEAKLLNLSNNNNNNISNENNIKEKNKTRKKNNSNLINNNNNMTLDNMFKKNNI